MEELKKEWSDEFDEQFTDYELDAESQSHTTIRTNLKNFISSLLAKQQDIPMGYSQWLAYGKKFGYHDYWKDMTRIALQEEFVKKVKGMLMDDSNHHDYYYGYNDALNDLLEDFADIKSKLKI
jgi:hypothetical protein